MPSGRSCGSHGGVGLPATEMFSARGFLEIDSRHDRPPERLWGVLDEPRPLAAQIWDNDPLLMAEVGRRLAREFRVSVVDINFGCPVSDVTEKAHSGSYLLRYPDRVGRIVAAVAKACAPTPVTAKIRLGACRDAINACDVAQAVEDAGGAALDGPWPHGCRHVPRLGRLGGDFAHQALPVPHSPDRQRRHHHAAGRGRGLSPLRHRRRDDRPGGAQSALAFSPGPGRTCAASRSRPDPSLAEQRDMLLEHFRLLTGQFGEQQGTVLMRKYACCYANGRPGARAFRANVGKVATSAEFFHVVEHYFPREDSPSPGAGQRSWSG